MERTKKESFLLCAVRNLAGPGIAARFGHTSAQAIIASRRSAGNNKERAQPGAKLRLPARSRSTTKTGTDHYAMGRTGTTDYGLRTMDYRLRATGYRLQAGLLSRCGSGAGAIRLVLECPRPRRHEVDDVEPGPFVLSWNVPRPSWSRT